MKFSLSKLKVEGAVGRETALENDDLLPVPLERRTWNFMTFTIFWFAGAGTVANWLGGASYLTFGLTVWEGLLCTIGGNFLISIFMVVNGRAGSVYHVGFPVYCRSSFGVFGAHWPVFNRALSACVWNGVNNVTGGQCLYVMLHSMFPSIANIPNHMPAASALNSANMMTFMLFWLLTAAGLFLSIPKWKYLIYAKGVAYVIASAGMLALALTESGGIGDIMTRQSVATGTTKAWLIVRFTLLAAASCATFASNASDWQRNATKPNDPILGQLIGFPFIGAINNLLGSVTASTSLTVAGSLIWNPVTYLDFILTKHIDEPKYRAAAFFISLGFVYCQVFSSIFENVLPAGNDIVSFYPKYLTMKRAFAICMLMTIVINPWYLLGSASIFVTFIGSYQIFLFAIIGVCLCDYYVVCRGRLDLSHLYTADPEGPYYYTYGFNLRAIAGYIVGVAANFVGFLGNMGVTVSTDVQKSFYFALITTTVASGLTYWILNLIWPQTTYKLYKGEKFHEWSQDEVEVYAAGVKSHGVGLTPDEIGLGEEKSNSEDDKNVEGVRTHVLEA